ncbi:hypothetical protein BABINDRAFT_163201 [Babjeviella inositovora NRRL Y-12698]|uniref:MutL C-terminal dimerisation domain-containing protein n=1 Tax=Babjeviella inositovora NRRL Y-12698 TaxID=984486 RepID=A0A1E3QJC6_9ASCO|nr:uncharacterized protein BABINDRAFT_163201 [Babjeviella inositovora NRRL Y-12698]ODQ77813.1 hypothetical protein BABINDRAFT_163201 [Babjeviella inositovora NRRL Y-12698]
MRSINHLDDSVCQLLLSQVSIRSLACGIREVIQNSIDATAKNIVVSFDLSNRSFLVMDDGCGMSPAELDAIGKRFHTSKISHLDDLKTARTYGFRGESLYSIAAVSNLTISSKRGDSDAFYTTLINGITVTNRSSRLPDSLRQKYSDTWVSGPFFSCSGTVVEVTNMFGNVPVRVDHMKKLSKYRVLDEIRRIVFDVSIFHPEVQIRVTCSDSGAQELVLVVGVLHTSQEPAMSASVLNSVYGISTTDKYEYLSASFENYSVCGVIGLHAIQSKAYQLVFMNTRRVYDPDLFRDISKLFIAADFGSLEEEPLTAFPLSQTMIKSPKKITSVGRPILKHPVFVLKVVCPVSVSDLIQDPNKGVYQSKHFSVIRPMIIKILTSFLKVQGYTISLESGTMGGGPKNPDVSPGVDITTGQNASQGATNLSLKRTKIARRSQDEVYSDSVPRMGGLSVRKRAHTDSSRDTGNLQTALPSSTYFQLQSSIPTTSNTKLQMLDLIPVASPRFKDLNKVSIERRALKSARIVSQLERKFILVTMRLTLTTKGFMLPTLLVVDQHAADERIRVERYMKELIELALYCDSKSLLSEPIEIVCIDVSSHEQMLLETFSEEFAIWGIKFDVFTEPTSVDSFNEPAKHSIYVTHLPLLFSQKCASDLVFLKRCLLQHAYDLQEYRKPRLVSCKRRIQHSGDPHAWFKMVKAVPRVLIDIINSKACRSAIMFGDVLDREAMRGILDGLSTCMLPFQCAHGRPSIVPLADLKTVNH